MVVVVADEEEAVDLRDLVLRSREIGLAGRAGGAKLVEAFEAGGGASSSDEGSDSLESSITMGWRSGRIARVEAVPGKACRPVGGSMRRLFPEEAELCRFVG